MFHQYSLNPIFLEKLFRSSVLMIFLLLPVLSYCQQYDPCNDSLYISLKSKSLDDLSEREYEYFSEKEKECYEYNRSQRELNAKIEARKTTRTSRTIQKEREYSLFKGGMRIGADLGGKYIMSGNGEESDPLETSVGFLAAYEQTFVGDELFRLGLGLDYQINRDLEDSGKFSFSSFYIYATSRIVSNLIMVGRYGYGIYDGDDDHTEFTSTGTLEGGNYYSGGVQLILDKNIAIDVSYHVNKGVYPFYISEFIDNPSSFLDDWIFISEDLDVEYKRMNISFIVNY